MKEKNNKPILITIILTGIVVALISTLPYFLNKKKENDKRKENKAKLEEQIEELKEIQKKHGYLNDETEEITEESTEETTEETTEKSTLSAEELERGYWVDENGLEHEFEFPMAEVEISNVPDSLKDELGEDVFNEVIEEAKKIVREQYVPRGDYKGTKYTMCKEEDGKKIIMFDVERDVETFFDVIVNPDNAVWARTY